MEVSIPEAAQRLGVSVETIRRRLRNGVVKGRQEKTAQGFRWWVDLEDVAHVNSHITDPASPRVEDVGQDDGHHNGHQDSGLVDLLQDQVKRLDAHVEDLQQQLADRTREISELHQLLGARSLNPGVPQPWWAFWRR